MRADEEARRMLASGFAAIRDELGVPGGFPEEVVAEAAEGAGRPDLGERLDATPLPLVTLDPLGSTDLDQAYALAAEGDDVVLSYAIADVAAFLARGSALDAEVWRRGVTVYAPDGRVPLHPPVLSEGAASLLPDGERPAVLLTVAVAPDGTPTLRSARRATVRSRAQLAYESVRPQDLSPLLPELARRVAEAERRRGAGRIEFPSPEVVADASVPGGLTVRAAPRRASEDLNAALSLAANLAVAQRMLAAGVGLFRVMPDPPPDRLDRLRRTARGLGVRWPKGQDLRTLAAGLDPTDPHHAAFLRAIRQAGGGATYASLAEQPQPWHSVIAAPYAHATAPLRRLADRYVLDLCCELEAGAPDPGTVEALGRLAPVMEAAETRAARVDGACIDLVEAVVLHTRVGEVFPATVIDADGGRARIQLLDPPVRASVEADGVEPGQQLRVRLAAAEPERRRLDFDPA